MSDENKPEQQKTPLPSPAPTEKMVPLSWVIFGIAAVVIMWALSSWLFK